MKFVGGCVLAVVAGIGAFALFDLRINVTDSAPLGVYRLDHRVPSRGDRVFACFPGDDLACAARYLDRPPFVDGPCHGFPPLVKTIAGVPGDLVAVSGQAVLVNGEPLPGSRPLARDGAGRPMPVLWRGRLDDGQYWLASPLRRSYDSRYFGPVDRRAILGVATLLWRFQ